MIKYLYIILIFTVNHVLASNIGDAVQQNSIAQSFLNSELKKNLEHSYNENTENQFLNDTLKQKKQSDKKSLTKQFDSFKEVVELTTKNKQPLLGVLSDIKEKQFKNIVEKKDGKEFTVYYFISTDMPTISIARFVSSIEKLQKTYPNIQGKILLNGYPYYYEKAYKGTLKNDITVNLKNFKTKFGKIDFKANGDYIYTPYEHSEIATSDQDIVVFNDINKTKHTLTFYLKNIDDIVKVRQKYSPVGVFKYLRKLRDNNISSANVGLYAHPWAFKYFHLKKVPAYALSICKSDERFKNCDHKYLVHGDISLLSFFSVVSDADKKYKDIYYKLNEVE